MNSYFITISGWWWLLAILFVCAVLISIYAYKNTVPPIPKSKKVFLITLRSIALTILLFALFEPIFTSINTFIVKPKLAVLLDNSISMETEDALGSRLPRYKKLLNNLDLKPFDTNIIYYRFDSEALQIENFSADSLKFNGNMTDISKAIRTINNIKEQTNTCAILLISDGAFNTGNNPIFDAENFAKPIYTIGFGDTTNPKDVSISSILLNEIAYINSPIPITVNFNSVGFDGNETKITLFDNGKQISEQQFTLNQERTNYIAIFEYTPTTEGIHKISATATTLDGEITNKNNSHSEYVKVIENKRTIAIFAGAPSADFSFIKRVLQNEEGTEILEFVQKTGSEFYNTPSSQQIAKTDVFIFVGFPINSTPSNIVTQINTELNKGKSLMFVAGLNTDYNKLKAVNENLPFQVISSKPNEFAVAPVVNSDNLANPILRIYGTDDDINLWNKLPPIFRTETFVKTKPEAEVLATMKVNNVELKEPLILTRQLNQSKQVAVMGYGLFRWKMLDFASNASLGKTDVPDVFEILIDNSYRWLSVQEQNKQVNIRTTKKHFNQNEKVEFIGELYDASFIPIENANITISTMQTGNKDTKRDITLTSAGNGRYFGYVEGLPKGDFSFEATATLGQRNLGTDNGRFSIGELAIEYQNLKQNTALLKAISERTLGKYYSENDIDNIAEQIINSNNFIEKSVSLQSEFLIWNWLGLLIIAILLFSIEWFLRKRAGLL